MTETPNIKPSSAPDSTAQENLNKKTSIERTLLRGFLIASLLVAANFASILVWEMHNPRPRIVTVDLNGLVRSFIAETAQSGLSDSEKRSRTEAFARKMDTALQGLAARQNTIILTAPAVIAGIPNITEAFKKGITE